MLCDDCKVKEATRSFKFNGSGARHLCNDCFRRRILDGPVEKALTP